MSPDERIDLGSHELRVRSQGEGAPAFVCLHGLVDRLEIWDHLAPGLAARGSLLRVDQRGHGSSGAPRGPYSREDLAGDVTGILDARNIERASLVGRSMGGIVSMTTALLYPERIAGLVLLGTASHCNERTARWYERIAAAGEADGLAGLSRAIYGRDSKQQIEGAAQPAWKLKRNFQKYPKVTTMNEWVFPGNIEVCDDHDNDCDAATEAGDGETDPDGDGLLNCADTDNDGDGNACDNCPAVAHADQAGGQRSLTERRP